jgi:DNA-binding CsgD family transcriptional regulator
MKIDCMRIIEAGYAPAGSEAKWLAGVLEPFEPLARGMGVMAGIVTFGDGPPRVGGWIGRGPIPAALPTGWQALYAFLAREHPSALRAVLWPIPSVICWATERSSLIPESSRLATRTFFQGSGIRDAISVLAAEPTGPSLLVTVPYSEKVSIPSRTLGQLTRATAHLCSALRLRRRASEAGGLEAPGGLAPDVEAVLDPSGKVHHASGEAEAKGARASLIEIVRRVEHARGRLRHTDPEEALEIWQALFDGRWSVVERSDSDGRRFLLARRNRPGERDPMALTQGERDVLVCAARGHANKYIAFLLGVATSTVSTRLESALRKMGLSSRREAIAVLGGGEPPQLADVSHA